MIRGSRDINSGSLFLPLTNSKSRLSASIGEGSMRPRGSIMLMDPGGMAKGRSSITNEGTNTVSVPRKSGTLVEQGVKLRPSMNFGELEPIYDENSRNPGLSTV